MKENMNNKPKLVERRYLFPFILVTSLFALWGFANDITNPMVAAFQTLMELPASEAALVQFACGLNEPSAKPFKIPAPARALTASVA